MDAKRERLQALAEALMAEDGPLRALTKFDMREWGSETPCGTVACAMGLAARMPPFQALGLRPDGFMGIPRLKVGQGMPELHGFAAAEELFGLTYAEARLLFGTLTYNERQKTSPKAVGRRIERLLAGKLTPAEQRALSDLGD